MKSKRLLLLVLLLVILAVAAVIALRLGHGQENGDHVTGTEASANQIPSDLPASSPVEQAPAQPENNEKPSEPVPTQAQTGDAAAVTSEEHPSGQETEPIPPPSDGQTTAPSEATDGTPLPEQTPSGSQGSSANEGPIIEV